MIQTVYDAKTGKPRRLFPVDVREQLTVGLITLEKPVDIVEEEPIEKPAPKTRQRKAKE